VIKVLNNSIILLFLFIINCLEISELLAEASQFLDFRSKLLLFVLDFIFNLDDNLSYLLQSLFLFVIKDLICLRDTLDLFIDVGVTRNSFLLF
jgi:hypothetical protein